MITHGEQWAAHMHTGVLHPKISPELVTGLACSVRRTVTIADAVRVSIDITSVLDR